MTQVTPAWVLGSHHGLVWPTGIALVDGVLGYDVAEQLWHALVDGADLADFLDRLSAACGGLLAIPGFAIGFTSPEGMQFAARGDFRVRTDGDGDTEQEVSGRGAVTWSERLVPTVSSFSVLSADPPPGAERAIASGVVPASSIAWGKSAHDPDADGRDTPDVLRPDPDEKAPMDDSRPARAGSSDDTMSDLAPTDTTVDPDVVSSRSAGTGREEGSTPRHSTSHATEFDDLWGPTVVRSIEEAAIRDDDDDLPPEAAPAKQPAVEPETPNAPETPAGSGDGALRSSPGKSPGGDGVSSLITGVPGGSAPVAADESPMAVARGDHDGETIARMDADWAGEGSGADSAYVLAIRCHRGHSNPPHQTRCRVCADSIPSGTPQRIPQPVVGRVVASTGESRDLVGVILIGRKPRADRVQGTELPKLLALPAFDHVSSVHLELRVDGWTVTARDLDSLNGSYLQRPGEPPFRLTQPSPVFSGDVVDLGHGASLTFEQLA
jgi:hypothetical protein